VARLKATAPEAAHDRLAELEAMPDPRQTPEWREWHAYRSARERGMMATPGDLRLLMRSERDPRYRECVALRSALHEEYADWLRRRGYPESWAQQRVSVTGGRQ
jgi:hypothetical protein